MTAKKLFERGIADKAKGRQVAVSTIHAWAGTTNLDLRDAEKQYQAGRNAVYVFPFDDYFDSRHPLAQ